MIIIQEKIVHEDILQEEFVCNLSACKGACCWEGELGAPLEAEEVSILLDEFQAIQPYLTQAGKKTIEEQGLYTFYPETREYGTPLIDGAACAYISYDNNGTAQCGIEKAHAEGATSFKKPISCHLYPIRIKKDRLTGFETLQYDRWDICSAACQLGRNEQVPLFEFLKEPLIRKFGQNFYDELTAAASYLDEEN